MGVYFSPLAAAQSQATGTVTFDLEKKISGPAPLGYQASQFMFLVSGYNTPVTLTAFTQDSANGSINLPVGTYELSEIGPTGFVPQEWTVQWSGAGCVSQTGPSTSIVIEENDIGKSNFGCRADNQWRYGNLFVSKQFVGTTTATPTDFSFTVTQGTEVRFSGAFEADGGNEIIVSANTYNVTEESAPNYSTSYSADCAGVMPQSGSKTCIITNTYIEETASSTGQIIIEKQTLPDGSQTAFTFDPSWSEANFTLSDGEQSTSSALLPGTYSITETLPSNWTQTNVVCSDGSLPTAIALEANETVTCVFTNSLNGGGENEALKYLVFGYVWHDRNENQAWDLAQPNPVDDELDLDGWVIRITDGVSSFATTTDEQGYYYFEVPAGVWKITEEIQPLWGLTFPVSNEHTAIVTDSLVLLNQPPQQSLLHRFAQLFGKIALAETQITYGPYNFGNVQFGNGGGDSGGSSDSDGGGSRSSGSRSNRSGSLSRPQPQPLVLGEATGVMPVGAPDTGAGGTAIPAIPSLQILVAVVETNKLGRLVPGSVK